MGKLLDIVTPNHVSTARDYLGRMLDDKVHCMDVAKGYGPEYWDGPRRYGYGGYRYIPGWWADAAKSLIDLYDLKPEAKVLDVGCGKGFLLKELKSIITDIEIAGFDISEYGLTCAPKEVRPWLHMGAAQETYAYADKYFDLAISINCLHNLTLPDLAVALGEIERVGKNGYVVVESYRSDAELFNLQCWALTAETFLRPGEWKWLFQNAGYMGDFEFIFFS